MAQPSVSQQIATLERIVGGRLIERPGGPRPVVLTEAGRLLLYRLGWLKSKGKPAPLDSALVKLYLSEAYVQSSLDALQVHGAYGYMTESELEREVRDAIGSRIYSGTSEMQRNIVASHLGL